MTEKKIQAHSQNDVYLLIKTVGFLGQIKVKQISRSWVLIIYFLSNYYTKFSKSALTLNKK